MSQVLLREDRDGVAFLRMNRPDKRNAFNRELSVAVHEALDEIESNDDHRVVVFAGTGDSFTAGADMNEALAAIDGQGSGDGLAQVIVRVTVYPKPVIAAINGFAFGGGAALAVSCDLRLASERASFRFPGTDYGLVVGGSQLPRVVGVAKAKELIYTARVVEAAEAERIGLVNRVVPHDELDREVAELAVTIARKSPDAVRWSKAVIDAMTTVEKGIALEADANRALRGSADHVARFREATARVARRGDGKEAGR